MICIALLPVAGSLSLIIDLLDPLFDNTDFTESSFCVSMASMMATPVGAAALSKGQKFLTIRDCRVEGSRTRPREGLSRLHNTVSTIIANFICSMLLLDAPVTLSYVISVAGILNSSILIFSTRLKAEDEERESTAQSDE
jgi:hypothetical protein